MNRRSATRWSAAAFLAAGATLALATAAPAGAAPVRTDELGAIQTRCERAIDQRLTTLGDLTERVGGAQHLSADDRGELTAEIDHDTSGLSALRTTIAGESTLASLRQDCRAIVDDYRVYVLLAPKTHLVVGADAADAALDAFSSADASLSAAIDRARTNGTDAAAIADAQAKQQDMNAQTTRARGLVDPIVPAVIALTPADFNAGTAGPKLDSSRQSLRDARAALAAAKGDLDAAIHDLTRT
ncbi:MAG TPA: hypothetical protein VIB48_07735 [Acidimicrobiia bacterium]|jgi:hypothetical protein